MSITRRIGSTPEQRGSATGQSCPDIFELSDGNFLVIGKVPGVPNITAADLMKHAAGIGIGEQAVVIPRQVLLDAKADIPDGPPAKKRRRKSRRSSSKAAMILHAIEEWVNSDVVTADTEFGNGYRECQRDLRDKVNALKKDDV